jgi:hypothetical protein
MRSKVNRQEVGGILASLVEAFGGNKLKWWKRFWLSSILPGRKSFADEGRGGKAG